MRKILLLTLLVILSLQLVSAVTDSNCPLSDEIKRYWPFVKDISLENISYDYSSGKYNVDIVVDTCAYKWVAFDCHKVKFYINNNLIAIKTLNRLTGPYPEGVEYLDWDTTYCAERLSGDATWTEHLRFTFPYELAPGTYEIKAYGQFHKVGDDDRADASRTESFNLETPLPESETHECSDESQIILKLSSSTNAHGELWNQENYGFEICYDEIFGTLGDGDRTCSGKNKLLGLSAVTNAHAEIPSLDNYQVDVCYDNLVCEARDVCEENEKMIVSLSADTNAHVAMGDEPKYPFKICCKPAPEEINITGAYWADMLNNPIDEADLNDRVKLVVEGEELGREINFTIFKNIRFWFDSKLGESSSLSWTTWVANESGNFYFVAEVNGEEMRSGNLEVSDTENNEPPHAEILIPEIGEIYFKNEKINFTQASYDADDFINYTWDFGDRNKVEGSTRDYRNYNTSHSYTIDGQMNIKLHVTDERGVRDSDQTSILIISPDENKKYVFAHISRPEWGENILGRFVQFNATTSYAVEIEDGEISCIAGPCPEETSNGTEIIGNLPDNLEKRFENMSFYWEFSDSSVKNETGINGALFTKPFSNPGPHWAVLTASINPSSTTETEFNLYFEETFCYESDGQVFWIEDGQYKNSMDDCYRQEGLPTEFCCPSGFSCEQEGQNWICMLSEVELCSDYKTEESCESYNPRVAEFDIESKVGEEEFCGSSIDIGGNCWKSIENCRCIWNSTSQTCESAYDVDKWCEPTGEIIMGSCIFRTQKITNCTAGYRVIEWNATWTGLESGRPNSCVGGIKQIPCISVELAFFTLISLIISISLIVIFYLRKKER